jgi:DNA polymerase-3 subunit gamma/tau
MRDAQSAFDQVISFAGTEIKKEDVEMALGVAGADTLIRVVNGIANHEPAEALAVVDDVVMRGHDLRNFCRDLLAHFRDLLVSKVSGSEELLESAICDREELARQATLFSEADLVRFFHSLAETETLLKTAAHPRYQLEIGLVKLMEMRRLESLNLLLERLTALEESVRTGKAPTGSSGTVSRKAASAASAGAKPSAAASVSRSAPAASPPWSAAGPSETGTGMSKTAASSGTATESYSAAATKTALANETVGSPGLSETGTAPASEIEQIKTALGTRRKMLLVTALDAARQSSIEGNELSLEFAPETRHFRDTLAKSDNVKILREVCKEITGRDLGVRFVVNDPEASAASATGNAPPSKEETERRDKQSLREQAEKDPTVRQMLKTFRGEIVDVKRVEPAK